jgi:hypothetical protein
VLPNLNLNPRLFHSEIKNRIKIKIRKPRTVVGEDSASDAKTKAGRRKRRFRPAGGTKRVIGVRDVRRDLRDSRRQNEEAALRVDEQY